MSQSESEDGHTDSDLVKFKDSGGGENLPFGFLGKRGRMKGSQKKASEIEGCYRAEWRPVPNGGRGILSTSQGKGHCSFSLSLSLSLSSIYLTLYNWTILFGWLKVLYLAVQTLRESGHEHVYDAIQLLLQLTQTSALLEIIHGLVGLVTFPISVTLSQIGCRLYLTWGILWSFPQTQSHILVTSLVISWSITEFEVTSWLLKIIWYSFFGMKEALGFAPSWHLWINFLVVDPSGGRYPNSTSSEPFEEKIALGLMAAKTCF
ncbi:very-long-chain (3R)-3-hydroxyacyl-CoA dehydratase PASTICCINO 2-like [Juglans regia]|uniref:Very-long-chain (3R)-3-hydroxyacyl-CoA dehydratase n=1 Tax=Juglans regia TaxID=51240 RepID=A0A6P9ECJ3_JUGRE|nr:very-long-chain (3R)-3-hydroxyacyl-CoA dehydratase PASTICCINO 2-like [Juglans regia]